MKNRTLNFSKIQALSPANRCAAGTGKIFLFVQPWSVPLKY